MTESQRGKRGKGEEGEEGKAEEQVREEGGRTERKKR